MYHQHATLILTGISCRRERDWNVMDTHRVRPLFSLVLVITDVQDLVFYCDLVSQVSAFLQLEMPACDQWFQCLCNLCCEVNSDGLPASPHGKRILQKYQSIHLSESHSSASGASLDDRWATVLTLARQAVSESAGGDVDAITTALFASTISDNGPDIASQPSKLWCSRNQVQQDSPHALTGIGPEVDQLTNSIHMASSKLSPPFCWLSLLLILSVSIHDRP